jgi:hypothetical protein
MISPFKKTALFWLWPITEVATRPTSVRSVGCSGLDLLNLSFSRFDPQPTLSDSSNAACSALGKRRLQLRCSRLGLQLVSTLRHSRAVLTLILRANLSNIVSAVLATQQMFGRCPDSDR